MNAICIGGCGFSRDITFVIKTWYIFVVILYCVHTIRPDKRHPIIRKPF